MTRMMNKILCNAIIASQQGYGGYAVRHNHYAQYNGMKKIVDRLVTSGLVRKRDGGAGRFLLEPTELAHVMMQEQPERKAA